MDGLQDEPHKIARRDGATNSKLAAYKLRATSQRAKLLETYDRYPMGLADAEAGNIAGVPTAHKRVSELIARGLLAHTSNSVMRGRTVRVCTLTAEGMAVVDELYRVRHNG